MLKKLLKENVKKYNNVVSCKGNYMWQARSMIENGLYDGKKTMIENLIEDVWHINGCRLLLEDKITLLH